jgi:hypothetical protein
MRHFGYIRRARKAYAMKLAGGLAVTALVLALVAPATAAAQPTLRADPDQGEPGDEVALHGRGWVVGDGCSNSIILLFRQGTTRMKLGEAVHGDGRFLFNTHYQQAEPGTARFVAKQVCTDRVIYRRAYVTIGRAGDETVRYRGQTEHGGRVRFEVVDGNEVRNFRFMNRCATDRERGSLVPGTMPIGDISFSRHGGRFNIFGRFRANGVVKGNAREQISGCDSGKMTWRAERVD